MTSRLIPVSGIRLHWELNRAPDKDHIQSLARFMNESGFNKSFPLRVVVIEGEHHLAAGHHRLAAATQSDVLYPNLPLTEVWAELVDGTLDDVIRIMQEDNFRHDASVNASVGLPLTRQQKTEQCKRLLMFSEYFGKSNRSLEEPFGVPHQTIARWREEVSVTLRQIGDAVARATAADAKSAILTEFAISESRLTEMLRLIESGEREVTRGGTTYTQKTVAGEARKRDEREVAIEAYRNAAAQIRKLINDVVTRFPSLQTANVRSRLFTAFDMNQQENASEWALPALRRQLEQQALLRDALMGERSAWSEELRRLHAIHVENAKLTDMGEPYSLTEVQTWRSEVATLATSDWEATPQLERLEGLRLLCKRLPDIVKEEKNARAQEKQRDDLNIARQGASAECSLLFETFQGSGVEDNSGAGYRSFLQSACELGGYSSKELEVDFFLIPDRLETADLAHRIRSIADKIRVDLSSANPPAWMSSFFPAPVLALDPEPVSVPASSPVRGGVFGR